MSCEFSWLALEPAVGTRILDIVEASSMFSVDQPGSGVALIFSRPDVRRRI